MIDIAGHALRQTSAGNSVSVLVVEDEPLLLYEAADFLEDASFRVHTALNAASAIDELERHDDIGVLFTDVQMPGEMNGLALAKTVRDRWPRVGIIVTSGHIVIGDHDLPESGVFFFPKPYVSEHVVREVRRMAQRTAG